MQSQSSFPSLLALQCHISEDGKAITSLLQAAQAGLQKVAAVPRCLCFSRHVPASAFISFFSLPGENLCAVLRKLRVNWNALRVTEGPLSAALCNTPLVCRTSCWLCFKAAPVPLAGPSSPGGGSPALAQLGAEGRCCSLVACLWHWEMDAPFLMGPAHTWSLAAGKARLCLGSPHKGTSPSLHQLHGSRKTRAARGGVGCGSRLCIRDLPGNVGRD